MSTISKPLLTAQEYLVRERLAEFRSEFYRGETFAVSGGSASHSRVGTNLVSDLNAKLEGYACAVYNSDLRILVSRSGLYTYPDASVICGELEFNDHYRDTVVNPTLLAEVLSYRTEAYDRGKKFEHYRKIPSLREYLLIAQDRPTVERFSRNPDDTWTPTVTNGLDQEVELSAIGVTLSMAKLYARVDFSSEQPTLS